MLAVFIFFTNEVEWIDRLEAFQIMTVNSKHGTAEGKYADVGSEAWPKIVHAGWEQIFAVMYANEI